MMTSTFKIGLFGIGLDAYWSQFDGLKERLEGYLKIVENRFSKYGAEVVNAGLIDTVDKSFEAGHFFRKQDVDILFLYVTTYALSSTVLPLVRRVGVPVIVMNISPNESIDYNSFNKIGDRRQMTGEWLAHCSSCPVPEIANVFSRSGITFYQVTGLLDEKDLVWKEVYEWLDAARVASIMSHNRLGLMGNYYCGMLDIYSNLTLQSAIFGTHFEIVEVDELSYLRKQVSDFEIKDQMDRFSTVFEVQSDCSQFELERAARTAVALNKLVDKYQLGSLAYYHKGSGNEMNEDTMSSIILGNSMLTANGIPVAGEYEVKNAQAMKIMDAFDAGGSFTEYYAIDYKDDILLMGHDGPGHLRIAEGKIKVRPLQVYHGKVGKGLSVEMSVKNG
ncbi:MAG: hypothetical protein KAF41_11420, partial [Flavobacterium sp.]|nr:hypothetical protein [Flavobacterium sp.]